MPHILEIKGINIKLELHSYDLRVSKVYKIESEVRGTATNFKNIFKLEPGSSEQTFEIYVLDDEAYYTHLDRSKRFGSHLGDQGSKTYYRGDGKLMFLMRWTSISKVACSQLSA